MSDSTSLSCISASVYIYKDIEFTICFGSSQWLTNDNFKCV